MSAATDALDHLRKTAARTELFDVGRPSGAAWHRLRASLDAAWAANRVAPIAPGDGHGPRPRPVSGAYFGGDLAWCVTLPLAAALVSERRALDVSVDNVYVQIDPRGWPTRMALAEPRFTCLPDDPAARCAGVTVVADEHELIATSAHEIVCTFSAVFATLRRVSPYGLSGHWGSLADHLSSVSWLLHGRGAEREVSDRVWTMTESLVDAIQRDEPRLRARPRRFHFRDAVPPIDLPMRGTCCLAYTTPEVKANGGDGLCTTCPRRGDDERVRLVNERFPARDGGARIVIYPRGGSTHPCAPPPDPAGAVRRLGPT